MFPDFDNARILVTASGSGLGRVIAQSFLDVGARVHGCDLDDTGLKELEQQADRFRGSVADVADAAAVDRLFDVALARMGGVDVLVNNAGIAGPTGPVEACSPDDWRRTVQVNLDGAFHCIRRAVPVMKQAGGGSIINIASTAGQLGYPLRAPYAASKWALIGLTESLAMELGPDGIRVNAVCPGSLHGARMDRVIAAEAAALGVAPDEVRQGYLNQTSLRTFIDPQEIADFVLFLCSPDGSRINGQAIAIDGHAQTLRS